MDRNTIIGLVLIFALIFGYNIFNTTRLTKSHDKAVHIGDSLNNAGNTELAVIEYRKALKYKPNQPETVEKLRLATAKLEPVRPVNVADTTVSQGAISSPVTQSADPLSYGAFSLSAEGEKKFITLENSVLKLVISTKGGRPYSAELKDYKTWDGKPLILFTGDSTVYGFRFFTTDNKAVKTNDLYFTTVEDQTSYDATNGITSVVLRSFAGEDKYIEYIYTLAPESYLFDFKIQFHNLTDVIAANQNKLTFDFQMYIKQQEKGRQNEDSFTSVKYKYHQGDVEGFKERSTKEFEKADLPNRLKWVAFKDQFFSSVIIAEDVFLNGTVTSTRMIETSPYLRLFTSEVDMPYLHENQSNINLQFYLGPNHFSSLKKLDLDLEELVFLGRNIIRAINQYVIIPIFNYLDNSIANYGIIILILTLIIKLALSPLTHKSYQSMAKMKVLKPMVDEISKRYPKPDEAMKKQQATMDLYKRAGVNPLGGCLPMLLQMPILFAMFRFFPASIELRQEAFLWANDLSTYDSILDLPFKIPMYGDHISLFTLLMTISTILTMKINSPSGGQDQIPGMKVMMYMMPVMFMLFLNNFSAGLTYYYFLANVITFGQNYLSKLLVDENKLLKTLEENSKKPVKKSSWQKKLEEAAKNKGYNTKKK